VELYPEIKSWLFKLKSKTEQNNALLLKQIQEAGRDICGIQKIRLASQYLGKHSKGAISICDLCGEAYPREDGDLCKNCQGESAYTY
jgi:formylmethanofuran dehydrogenase subunit E